MTGVLAGCARVLALIVAGLIVASCGGDDAQPSALPTVDATPSPTSGATSPTPEAQSGIVLPTTSGGEFALTDVIGSPTLLWFWAPW